MRELERRITAGRAPQREQRSLLTRRCPEYNLRCRRLGLGGLCPHGGGTVLVSRLIGAEP